LVIVIIKAHHTEIDLIKIIVLVGVIGLEINPVNLSILITNPEFYDLYFNWDAKWLSPFQMGIMQYLPLKFETKSDTQQGFLG
jgi:hypothetical protein